MLFNNQVIPYGTDGETTYYGRNGSGRQTGIEISADEVHVDTVLLMPVNSKNKVANCAITIPVESINSVIAALRSFETLVRERNTKK